MDSSLQELVDLVAEAETAATVASDNYRRLAWELSRMMQAEGATEAVSDNHIASLETKHRYDQARLRGVLEFVPEADLVNSGAYAPEHQRLVEGRFNATKLKPFAKRGQDIRDVIDAARIEEEPRLKIRCTSE
jgi:hypothetical protein